jgi:hypothetical protein
MHVQHASAFIQQALVKRSQVRILTGIGNGHVEILVGFGHLQVITAGHGGLKAGLGRLDTADVLLGAAAPPAGY